MLPLSRPSRLDGAEGKTTEWKSQAPRAYQRRTLAADALKRKRLSSGANARRVRNWDPWDACSPAEGPIVPHILDGTAVRVRLDRKPTTISLLVVPEHFQEKACPRLDRGWPPVFRRKYDQISNLVPGIKVE